MQPWISASVWKRPDMRAVLMLVFPTLAIAQTVAGDRVIASDSPIEAVSFSADGRSIAAACQDHQVRFWNARTGEFQRAVAFNKEDVRPSISDRADLLVTTGPDGAIVMRDLETGRTIRRFSGPARAPREIAFSPDRKLIAGAGLARIDGSENTVTVWDASGTKLRALQAGLGGVSALAFSPDGATLVAAGFDTNLRAWRARDGELLRLIEDPPLAMFALAFSPDGNYLATAGADRNVYLWDTKTWNMVRKLTGQPEMISAMAFSPDSRILLTGGFSEFTLRNPVQVVFWELASGKILRSEQSSHRVESAAFSPDGTQAATASDRTVSIWAVAAAAKP